MSIRSFTFILFCISATLVAACTNTSGGNFVGLPAATPAALSTSIPLGSGAALVEQPVATTVPAPAGYGATVDAPYVTAAANTTIAITAGASPPATIPVIATAKRPASLRRMVSGQYNAVYYDVLIPSASITVAGNVSITQSFPAGTLSSSTSYYLAFYDGTQASPTWQTISGPVQPSGNSLTFSGTVSSFTLQQNGTYAFCIFSVAASGATPPPSQAEDEAYLSQGTGGIVVVNASGSTVTTLGIDSSALGLDDSGNIYNLYNVIPSASPGASSAPTPDSTLQYYANGSTTAKYTYQMSGPAFFVETSGSGELGAFYFDTNSQGQSVTTGQIWNPGDQGGPPDYTINSVENGTTTFDVQHDGTIYVGGISASGAYQISIYPPGSSTPSRTVPETIVPQNEQSQFAGNYMTVGPDGTIYVTENSFICNDPFAGLYIYPPSGNEVFVATTSSSQGAGPQGVDVDAAGNIYVVNNDACIDLNTDTFKADTLHDIEVFAAGGTSVLRHITGNFTAYPIITAPDGTIFFGSFPFDAVTTGVTGTFLVPPGSTTPQQITSAAEPAIVLYNGYQESAAQRHRMSAVSMSVAAARSGPAAFLRYLRMAHHIH